MKKEEFYQFTIDDLEVPILPAIMVDMSDKAIELFTYLKKNHVGRHTAINAIELCDKLLIATTRDLRYLVSEINEKEDNIIQSSSCGYWIFSGFPEDRSEMLFNRTFSNLKKAVNNEVQLNMLYRELNEIKERLGL